MTTLVIDTDEFPNLHGQEAGRELELELTAIVTRVQSKVEGGSPSTVELVVVRVDIAQTT